MRITNSSTAAQLDDDTSAEKSFVLLDEVLV